MYINPDIAGTERVFPMQGRSEYLRFDMNENPEGLPTEFVDSVLAEITPEFLATYPEPDDFVGSYARFVGVPVDNIIATNGSDMAIRYLLETFCEKGHEVVTVSPTFEMYWVNCNILGLTHVPVLYQDDLTINADDIVSAISDRTDAVVLLNPNNPVGNVYAEEEVLAVIDKAEECGALVIIDEAYHYFYDKTFLHLAMERENVALLRTFSKLFSLAACRLGVVVASKRIIDCLKRVKLTFDVNSIALLFGKRIVQNPDLVDRLIAVEREGRDFLIQALEERGYEVRDCRGNFVFVKTKRIPAEVALELEQEKRVLVKYWSGGLLSPYLRISTGSRSAMERLIPALLEIDAR